MIVDAGVGDEGARAIATNLGQLTSLNLAGNGVSVEGARAIAANLGQLTSLNLAGNGVGVEGARAIAANLGQLTTLDLAGNGVGDEGARAIAANLGQLTTLSLGYNGVGDEGARAIATNLGQLTSLNLAGNGVGDEGARAIATNLGQLTTLELTRNGVGDEGARAIATNLGQLTTLDLAENGVGLEGARAIATNLGQLTTLDLAQLTLFDLIGNGVGDEGARAIATNLGQLTTLNLAENGVGLEGARAIAANLGQLTTLDLRNNGVDDEGARAIAANLGQLTSLNLAGNGVGDEGARAIAANLGRLTSLDLGFNGVGDEGARLIAANLGRLTSLDLAHNGVGDEGVRAILEAHVSSSRLWKLDLSGNRVTGDVLPLELASTSDAAAIRAAYRRYSRSPETARRPLNEAKLIVVGNEAVGKTSLVKYLTTGDARDPSEAKTPGMVIRERIETQGWRPEGSDIHLNVWDFGGQEIMHGTHRFFLSQRCLYLLVLEARREDDDSIYNWLRTIRNRGGDAPVIVVVNKCDDGTHRLRLDLTALTRDYAGIVTIESTSCDPGDFAERSVAALRRRIADTLAQDVRLAQARSPIPNTWLSIKTQVANLARDHSILESQAFTQLCVNGGVIDTNEQGALLLLLHELGVVVAHGLERDALAAFREVTLLDPNWLTGAVYTLLNSRTIADQGGEFFRRQLGDLLDPAVYPSERHEYILAMMQNPELGLCFELPAADEGYLIPEALSASQPDYGTWPSDSLLFRYSYEYLPPGLIPRFIVQAHDHLTAQPTRWRTGVVLGIDGCPVLVQGDRERRRIDIAVAGFENQRRGALAVVRSHLDYVHCLNPEAGPTAQVPLPDDPDNSVNYDDLLAWEQREGDEYTFYPQGVNSRKYSVGELLQGVRKSSTVTNDLPSSADSSQPSLRAAIAVAIVLIVAPVVLLVVIALTRPDTSTVIEAVTLDAVISLVMLVVLRAISESTFKELFESVLTFARGKSP